MPPRFIVDGVELARILKVTPETIRSWRRQHIIPFIRVNASTIRYDAEEVVSQLKSRSTAQNLERSGNMSHRKGPAAQVYNPINGCEEAGWEFG